MIEAGTYTATLVSHAITETKAGQPQAVAVFTLETSSGPQKITYYGSFSEKAAQYTIKNLITLGLKGNNPAGDLEIGKQVELVINVETDDQGKTRARVSFINPIGGARNAMDQDLAKAKLSALEAKVMAARQSMGVSGDDEIPF